MGRRSLMPQGERGKPWSGCSARCSASSGCCFSGPSRSLVLKQRGDGAQALRHRLPKSTAKERHDHTGRSARAGFDGQLEARRGPTLLGDELGPLAEPERSEADVPSRALVRLILDHGGGSLHATTSPPANNARGRAYTYRARRCLAHLKQIQVPPAWLRHFDGRALITGGRLSGGYANLWANGNP
jgi:hypothetical protein